MNKIFSFFIILLLINCSKIDPANFWLNYQSEKISFTFSDQGPWGGTAKIIWKSNNNNFNEKDILDYAKDNYWLLTDSINVKNGILEKSKNNYTFDIIKIEKLLDDKFKNSKLYIFKSGMIAVEPGNLSETEENGFLLLNSEKNMLKMYNRWGE